MVNLNLPIICRTEPKKITVPEKDVKVAHRRCHTVQQQRKWSIRLPSSSATNSNSCPRRSCRRCRVPGTSWRRALDYWTSQHHDKACVTHWRPHRHSTRRRRRHPSTRWVAAAAAAPLPIRSWRGPWLWGPRAGRASPACVRSDDSRFQRSPPRPAPPHHMRPARCPRARSSFASALCLLVPRSRRRAYGPDQHRAPAPPDPGEWRGLLPAFPPSRGIWTGRVGSARGADEPPPSAPGGWQVGPGYLGEHVSPCAGKGPADRGWERRSPAARRKWAAEPSRTGASELG
jgi:hypothetical protein